MNLPVTPSPTSSATDRLRISANVVFAVTQCLAPALPALGIGQEVGARSAQDPSPIVPPGPFFAIWGVIFAFCLSYAVYQARACHHTDTLLRQIGIWTALAFAGNTLWIVVAQASGIEFATFLILLGIWGSALATLIRIVPTQRDLSVPRQFCVLVPFSLLAGWTTAATFLSVAGLLDNWIRLPAVPEYLALGGAALVSAGLVTKLKANLWFTLTLTYAFVGIIMRTLREARPELALAAAIALSFVIVAYILQRRRTPDSPHDSRRSPS